jgi:membrane-associated phospholipid phosphatase
MGQSRHWLDGAQAHAFWKVLLVAVQVICGYFIVFIGPSRVLEGEHWPSDVVASYLLGSLVLLIGIGLYHALGVWWQSIQERRTGGLHNGTAAQA